MMLPSTPYIYIVLYNIKCAFSLDATTMSKMKVMTNITFKFLIYQDREKS